MKWLQGAVVVVAVAHFINMLANSMLFDKFAFGDNGWPITVDSLIQDDHLQPVTDFGYFYGLLTLLVDRVAFSVIGREPTTVIGLYAVCTLAGAFGIARTMAAVKMRLFPALFLIFCTALSVIPRGFSSPAHAFEAALLMNALAEHAAGRLSRALVLVTIAVFFKPSLGYVYGLILVGLILSEPQRWKRLLPAAVTGLGLILLLVKCFSWEAVYRTQLPFEAMKAYEKANFGFLWGTGQAFWLPEKPTWSYYIEGVAAIWLIASAVLLFTSIVLLRRFREPAAQFVITCSVLHFTFVLAMFGNEFSWIYYSYLLFVGAAVALNSWPRWPGDLAAIALISLAFCGQYEWLWRRDGWTWGHTERSEVTAKLFTPDTNKDVPRWQQTEEWKRIREVGAAFPGERHLVLVLTRMGCPQFLAPEVDGPHWWCLIEGYTKDHELERARKQLRSAEWLVLPEWHDNNLFEWPEFQEERKLFDLDPGFKNFKIFKIYRRKHPKP